MSDNKPDGKPADGEAADVEDAVDAETTTAASEGDAAEVDLGKTPAKKKRRRVIVEEYIDDDDEGDDDSDGDETRGAGADEIDDGEADDGETVPIKRKARQKPSRPAPRRPSRPAAKAATAGGSKSTVLTIVATVLTIAVLAALVLCAVMWYVKGSDLSKLKSQQADDAKAEQVASDYAQGAANIDYHDLTPWKNAVVKGVSDDMKKKYDAVFSPMEQLTTPLQWVSKGQSLDAVVNSRSGSIYKVTVYVRVSTTTIQNTNGQTSVVLYDITLDKDHNWQITDSGAPAQPGVLPQAGGSTTAPSAGATPSAAAPAPTGAAPTGGAAATPAPAPGG
ncbi:hypothetical protein P0W64_12510 [Tsukamurella sp. 8F]|uniref:hypothetical protein n=1 Tax=unclassified Tsukamurella TaxID=2633480 RepID=UPI0023B9C7B7|nr:MULTISPECIES: hypothetical protein [unclassified Tsukamurella]MDF0530301.1 hypothetical protein [Tsukamurella sp. 8J]MDF0587598.1 hypothetical protein [Tsukamurella sp. 8F]